MDIDRGADGRPIPEKARVVEQQVDAPMAAWPPDRLLGPPPGEVERVAAVSEVLGKEHIFEFVVVLGADRAAGHRLVADPAQNLVEAGWRFPHAGPRPDQGRCCFGN